MKASDSIKELAAALSKAQGEIKGAVKDSANPFFKSKYADLSSVVEAIRDAFAKNGLSYTQAIEPTERDEVRVETILLHASGEWLSAGVLALPVSKHDAQGFGSALTYARRYGLSAAVGVAPEDDDGNAATKAAPPKSVHSPTDGALSALTADEQKEANSIASQIVDLFATDKEMTAYEIYYQSNHAPEMMLAVWEILRPHSKIRSALKAMNQPRKLAA